MEFGCIGTGGVENNKDRPYECSVNECEQESACWCEYLVLDNQSIILLHLFLCFSHSPASEISISSGYVYSTYDYNET